VTWALRIVFASKARRSSGRKLPPGHHLQKDEAHGQQPRQTGQEIQRLLRFLEDLPELLPYDDKGQSDHYDDEENRARRSPRTRRRREIGMSRGCSR